MFAGTGCAVQFRIFTYQSLHGAVQSMSVVSPELGVGSLQRRVSVGLWLLDTIAQKLSLAMIPLIFLTTSRVRA